MGTERIKYMRKVLFPWVDVEEWLFLHSQFEIVTTIRSPYKNNPNKYQTTIYYKERDDVSVK